MPVNLHTKKQLVSRIVGVGVHRVRFDSDHLDDIADAITRDDIRSLNHLKERLGVEQKQKRFKNQKEEQHRVQKKEGKVLELVRKLFM